MGLVVDLLAMVCCARARAVSCSCALSRSALDWALAALLATVHVLRAPTLLAPDRLLERKERVSPPRFIGEVEGYLAVLVVDEINAVF